MNQRIKILIPLLIFFLSQARSQSFVPYKDTILLGIHVPYLFGKDSVSKSSDSLVRGLLKREKGMMDSAGKSRMSAMSFKEPSHRAPFLQFTGGYAGYNFNYRSALDTPYTEKNITQHQVISTLNFTIAGLIPIRVNTFIRRSNSAVFEDITDVQVAFDPAAYRNRLNTLMRNDLLRQAPSADSLAGKLSGLSRLQASMLSRWLQDPLTKQKLIEANEIVHVPQLTYNMQLPDSVNKKREDSIRKEASLLLSLYTKTEHKYDSLNNRADSLHNIYTSSLEKVEKYRALVGGGAGGAFNSPAAYDQWKNKLQGYAPDAGQLSAKEKWLLGVRSFGLGRNNVNTSELTAKNVSLNGVNFVYNSWYFLGLTAGLVDYRFHDFVVHPLQQPTQYMYMARAGLGRLESNYFILSVFGGQKQLLSSVNSAGISPTVKLTGLSVETKWQIEKNTFVIAEAAQSFSPTLPGSEIPVKSTWDLSDKSNKALSIKFSSVIPATASRLEAQYKFTGANFQSFNSFQTNAQLASWYVRGEQNFFRKELKLVASLRTNDFSNPYIIQDYKANTVFKSFSATFHKKALPIITVGYMPMSQLTMVGTQLEESRFQTFNASVSHFYRFGLRQASTNIVFTKFFNNSSDTGFIYYNSVNLYAGQTFFFRDFTATMALSHSKSTGYQYNVLEGNINVTLSKAFSFGMGAKLNNLNQEETGVGGFVNANVLFDARDKLYFHVEKGYLPGSGTAAKLVPNVIGTINFMKVFK